MADNMNNIWTQDFWGLTELTDAINTVPHIPKLVEQLGVFTKKPISTTSVSAEYLDGEVFLVPSGTRGAPGTPVLTPRRVGRPFSTLHLPLEGAVLADDVQNLRAFGKASAFDNVQSKVNDKLEAMKNSLDATKEWYRLGALKGIIYDSDGSTALLNLFTEFGLTAETQDFDFSSDAENVRRQAMTLKRTIIGHLGGYSMSGVGVLCSDSFFDELISHDTVTVTYKNYEDARQLRHNLAYETFDFGGITWINYRGNVSSQAFVADDTAAAFPLGTNGLFGEYYAPADYMETVNTPGLEFYAKAELKKFNKGMDIEAQTNPLMLCHRPQTLISLTMTTA